MRKAHHLLLYLLCIPLITGCWDQDDLNKRRIINGLSFDVSEKNTDFIMGAVRTLIVRGSGWGNIELYDDITLSEKQTVGEIGISLQNKVPGKMDISKTKIIMVGKELAKRKGILPLIEPIYRSEKGYLASKLIITKGRAVDVLSIEQEVSPIVFEILKLIENGEIQTYIPKTNTFEIWNTVTDNKIDTIIPLVDSEEDQLILSGVSLFNQDKYTGYDLTINQTAILLTLMGRLEATNILSISGFGDLDQPFLMGIENLNRDVNLDVDKSGEISVEVNVNLKAKVMSYYESKTETSMKKLNHIASKELTKRAKKITETLLMANSDPLGLGRIIATSHPQLWQRLNWDEDYSKISIDPKITVDLYNSIHIE